MQIGTDKWAAEPSTGLILQMREAAGNDMRVLEGVVTVAEVESIEYPDSPFLNFFLANLYQSLPEELSLEMKEFIEEQKFKVDGREHILEMPYDSREIIANMGPNPTFTQTIPAAFDYWDKWMSAVYIQQGNVKRAILQLNQAIEKTKNNPKPYDELLRINSLAFFFDERFQENMPAVAKWLDVYR